MFHKNVDQMIHAARESGARVLLVSQSKNYADWPATSSAHRADLTDEELATWQGHMSNAEEYHDKGDTEIAIRELEAALAIDGRYAETYQRLADLHRERGEFEAARKQYRKAHNTTLANFGTTPKRNNILRELSEQRRTLFLDADRIFEEVSPDGLVGFNLFVDFLHPNLAGHQLLARLIMTTLRTHSVPIEGDRWRDPQQLTSPEVLLARDPSLHARELRIRIVAEVLSERRPVAEMFLERLRKVAPDDPQLKRLERWLAGDLPFDFNLMYGR
jgi:tetratricopeptide (TPR) repeat protein